MYKVQGTGFGAKDGRKIAHMRGGGEEDSQNWGYLFRRFPLVKSFEIDDGVPAFWETTISLCNLIQGTLYNSPVEAVLLQHPPIENSNPHAEGPNQVLGLGFAIILPFK